MKTKRAYLIGSGGHAKVVAALLAGIEYEIAGVYDDNFEKWKQTLAGIPIIGPIERLEQAPSLPTVIAIGDNAVRESIANRYSFEWLTAVHPQAHVDRSVALGEGTVVMAGVIIQPDSRVGRHVIVNTSASVDHDCVVGDFVHIAPGARLAGSVRVETGVLIGIGAVAIPGVEIGRWTTVGAGAAIVGNLPAECIAKGVPAKFKRDLETSTNPTMLT
jgi:sugar O-acyltransferase (sialic acid O-acetyltransferase NeuD family)